MALSSRSHRCSSFLSTVLVCLFLAPSSLWAQPPDWAEIKQAYDSGEHWQTLALLRVREAAYPQEVGVHQSLALVLEKLGASDAALQHIEAWLALEPSAMESALSSRLRVKESKEALEAMTPSLVRKLKEAEEAAPVDPARSLGLLREIMMYLGALEVKDRQDLIRQLGLVGYPEEGRMVAQRWVWITADGGERDLAEAALMSAKGVVESRRQLEERVAFPEQSLKLGTTKGQWRKRGKRAMEEDEMPSHRVNLSAYSLDRFEATVAEYRRCQSMGSCPEPEVALDYTHPLQAMVGMTWEGARVYCASRGGRLPTEAEWEAAARGSERRDYPWGEGAPSCDVAHFEGCEQVTPYGQFGDVPLPVILLSDGATPEGLMNMAGNAAEWVQDSYRKDGYREVKKDAPLFEARGNIKVTRGGSIDRLPEELRSARREGRHGGDGYREVGVRCAWD